jgi:hypothetical protein
MAGNPDYKDLFRIFSEEQVEYLVVGAHAVVFYAEPRYTKDIDIWVRPTPENANKVWTALKKFGAPLGNVTPHDFTDSTMVYQIGIAPNRIDILMGVEGVEFENAWKNKVGSAYDGIPIHILGRSDLIKAKQTTKRPQDLLDLERLKQSDDSG